MRTPANKGKRYPPEVLTRPEIDALLAKMAGLPTYKSSVCEAFVALMWRCGMRVGEVRALRCCDVDLSEGVARIMCPKGGKQPRVVGLDSIVRDTVGRFLEVRPSGRDPSSVLICTRVSRGHVHPSDLRNWLRLHAKQAGITRRVHPHMLRHTFAYECALEGRPMIWISKALGHGSLTMTERYMSHLLPTDVVDDMKGRAA